MNKKSIIKMLKQAGLMADGEWWFTNFNNVEQDVHISYLERFATRVASAEREACADIAENWNSNGFPRTGVAEQIRARGQA